MGKNLIFIAQNCQKEHINQKWNLLKKVVWFKQIKPFKFHQLKFWKKTIIWSKKSDQKSVEKNNLISKSKSQILWYTKEINAFDLNGHFAEWIISPNGPFRRMDHFDDFFPRMWGKVKRNQPLGNWKGQVGKVRWSSKKFSEMVHSETMNLLSCPNIVS